MDVAIIGAGMAGLACGEALAEQGHGVQLFDKGRGPGGRMATRRVEHAGQTLHFDHGAQYFTARDPRFAARVERWAAEGVVARWAPVSYGAKDDAWVGTPGMNAPVKAMAAAQDVAFATRIEAVVRDGKHWRLAGEGAPETRFDAVVVAVPAEQAGALLSPHAPDFAAQAQAVRSHPCWTLMAAFAAPLDHLADTIRDAGAIGWAARNSAKPGRAGPASECWVVQASPYWSRDQLELSPEDIVPLLLAELARVAGPLPPVLTASAHRWRYAMVPRGGAGPLWDADQRLGACGDWLLGPRVENAWLSGITLAERMCAP